MKIAITKKEKLFLNALIDNNGRCEDLGMCCGRCPIDWLSANSRCLEVEYAQKLLDNYILMEDEQ